MTPERVAGLVARWVRFYTRGLPAPLAERRVGEIAADLHDHIAHERGRRIVLGILSRLARGLIADVSWRRARLKGSPMKPLPVLLGVLVVALGVAGIVLGEADDSPGLQLIGGLLVLGVLALGARTALRSK